MARLLLTSVLAFLIVALMDRGVPAAYGCTYGATYNPVNSSDVIVAGRVLGWDVADDVEPYANYIPIVYHVAVDRSLKGSGDDQLDIVDAASLQRSDGESIWSSNDCVGLDDDPTGAYLVIGARRYDDGTLREQSMFFYGDNPSEPQYNDALARIEGLKEPSHGISTSTLVIAAFSLALALAAGLAAWRFVRRRRTNV